MTFCEMSQNILTTARHLFKISSVSALRNLGRMVTNKKYKKVCITRLQDEKNNTFTDKKDEETMKFPKYKLKVALKI